MCLSMFKYFLFIFTGLQYILFNSIVLFQYNIYPQLYNFQITVDVVAVSLFIFTVLALIPCFFLFKKNSLIKHESLLFIMLVISTSVLLLAISKTFLTFFFYYETLLFTSVSLVYFNSPNVRSKKTAMYFLFWTQFGSFLVFIGMSMLFFFTKSIFFIDYTYLFNYNSTFIKLASVLVFLGFGVKIPIWPFHFWLSKTHVEASTGFSIFLSGVLVKTALLGLIKFKFIFIFINEYFLFFLLSYGLFDVSLKLFSQTDFKKLIAYSTIQEMSLLTMLICFDSIYSRLLFFYFCFFHTAISGIFFLINDFIYKRYGSRQINNVSGLFSSEPFLATILFISLLIFLGFPLTIKFYIELQFLLKIMSFIKWHGILFIFFVQYISMVFFFKNTIMFLFGPILKKNTIDLSSKELILFFYFIGIIFVLSVL